MTRRRGDPVVPPSVEREVDEEFDHHVELLVRDLMGHGWSPEEARTEARRRVGDVRRWKADAKRWGQRREDEVSRRLWWDELRQDLLYSIRQLRRAPSFAVIAIATLGIAIGANTAVFTVVNTVLLQPLPYPEPDRLSVLWTRYLPPSGFDIDKFTLSPPEVLDIVEETRTLESVGYYLATSRTLTGEDGGAERIRTAGFSPSMFPTLGIQPALGRVFGPDEDSANPPAVTVLSHALWERRFGSDPDVVGRTIDLNGVSTEVVGVMPHGFEFPTGALAWLPIGLTRENELGRASHWVSAIGRRAPGMTQADVDAELSVFADRWADEYPHNVAHFPWSQPLHTEVVRDAPERLRLLMAAVGLVLLVACANLANLLLTRAERRQGEVALRRTLGAGRGRITRQLATESAVLAGVSALVGLALSVMAIEALVRTDPTALPRLEDVRVDGTVLGFVVAVTGLTTLLFGVIPAYLAGRRAASTLASSSQRTIGGRSRSALRRLLVAGEVAVSLVVVILAGLVVQSFGALAGTDPRMDTGNLMTFAVSLPSSDYPDDEGVPMRHAEILDVLRSTPGVRRATATSALPFTGSQQWDFDLNDRPPRQEGDVAWNAGLSFVGSDYFETMGVAVLDGRTFGPEDRDGAPLVAVVSETLAQRYWPGERVIGKQIGFSDPDTATPWMTIVGVVADPVRTRLDVPPYPHLFVPLAQTRSSTGVMPRTMQIALRTSGDPSSVMPAVRARIAEVDRNLPLYSVATMEEVVASTLAGPRATTGLLAAFALIALILAAVGIYGVISYSVAGRTREIGVRIALGAERGEITRLIVGEGARPLLAGVFVGLAVAWFSTRLVEAMLYRVEPTDTATFVTLPLVLISVGFFASLVPALRATRIAPTEALREE